MAINAEYISNLLAQRVLRDLQTTDDGTNRHNLSIVTDSGMSYIWDNGNSKAYLPYLDTQELNMLHLREFQKKLIEQNHNCSFILAISDTTGTILYYESTPNFVEKP